MAGHSHASNIAVRKGAQDKKRAARFNKVCREITVATRLGGPDPDANPRLRLAIAKGKEVNLPNDRLKRAIDLGTPGLDDGKIYEEARYEGYAAGGVAIIVESLTDNRTRTVADIRLIFTKQNGNLGDAGSVGFMFDRVGEIVYPKDKATPDEMLEAGIEAGAQNVISDPYGHYFYTEVPDFGSARESLTQKFGEPEKSGLIWDPVTPAPITDKDTAEKVLKLIDALEDNDDVQAVFHNMDITKELAAELSGE